MHKFGDHWTAYNPPDPSTYPPNAKTYTIKKGDTLWALGQQFYGNAYLWPQLWEANTWITDAHWIYPGDVLLVQGEVVQQAQAGESATTGTPVAGGTPTPATPAPSGTGFTSMSTEHPLVTAADAVGGTTSPVPLATDADIYCFGYIGSSTEPMPNKISSWEDAEVHYEQGAPSQILPGSEGDLAFIDGGSATGLNAGDTYLLVVPGPLARNPATQEVIGREYHYVGQVKVLCTEATRSRALITQSCDEVPLGARLKPLPQIPIPLARIPSLPAFCDPASGKKNGLIVSAQGGDWMRDLGEGQLVHVNLGRDDQVQPGDFLTIYRDGIPGITPTQVLGEAAILTTENHTATARIVLMRYSMRVGDRVEIR
ncbi:MAG TPA: LysM peptidoglycan-binding domain-containing protein [Thermoanaerobaculia bacterium]|nr:LysM peptidoglycan-binding domain-containing protein [Thermoanaerobaculia bacterium]